MLGMAGMAMTTCGSIRLTGYRRKIRSTTMTSSKCRSETTASSITGGKEDCSDAVRGTNYLWRRVIFRALGAGVLTIKGAIDGWMVQGCIIERHGKERDIEVGQFDNYWYWGRPPTRNGSVVDTFASDGQPVRLTLWDAEMPKVVNSNVKVTRVPKWIWLPYFCFMWCVVRLSGAKTK